MPFIIPFIPLIAAGIGAGTSIGLDLSNQPSSAPATTTPTPTAQTPATSTGQKAAVANALPTLQFLTGGSVSPEYAAQWGGQQTGVNSDPQSAGNVQAAINQFFGLSAPSTSGLSTTGVAPTGNSITNLLSRVTLPSSSSGSGGGGIIDAALNSQEFKGFS